MSTVRDLANYFTKKLLTGFGNADAKLCRRGLDVQEEISLGVPIEGEQVSEDGQTVYLSGRITE